MMKKYLIILVVLILGFFLLSIDFPMQNAKGTPAYAAEGDATPSAPVPTCTPCIFYSAGYVKDINTSEPVVGARVEVHAGPRQAVGYTSSSGHFYIRLDCGNYPVSNSTIISKEGYKTLTVTTRATCMTAPSPSTIFLEPDPLYIPPVPSNTIVVPTDMSTPSPTPSSTPTISVPPPSASPSPSPDGGYVVIFKVVSDWGHGATFNVTIINNTTTAVNGWVLSWVWSNSTTLITDLWRGVHTQNGEVVSIKDAGYNAYIAPYGGNVTLGFNVAYTGALGKPLDVRLNGVICQTQ